VYPIYEYTQCSILDLRPRLKDGYTHTCMSIFIVAWMGVCVFKCKIIILYILNSGVIGKEFHVG